MKLLIVLGALAGLLITAAKKLQSS